MRKKFSFRRLISLTLASIVAVGGSIVAIDAPAQAVNGDTSEIDYALSLGAGQAVYAQDANALDLSANLTFETWYKVATNDSRLLLNKENAFEFGVDPNGNFIYALQSGGNWDWNNTGIVIPTGQWVHIGFTKSNTTSTLYVNGQSMWTQTGGKTTTSPTIDANPATITNQTSVLTIGGRAVVNTGIGSMATGGAGLTLDEIKLWSTARTQSDIAADMHAKATSGATGLVAYWNFNEGTTSNSSAINLDRSGQSNNLQFFGTPTGSDGNFVDVKTSVTLGEKTIVTFPRTYLPGVSGWTVPAGVARANVLAIAGGGGGGSRHAGGGGAGEVGSYNAVALAASSTVAIKVGAGGKGFDSTSNNVNSSGGNGQSTFFGADEFLGGGGGSGGTGVPGTGGSGGGSSSSGVNAGSGSNGTGTSTSQKLTRYVSAGAKGATDGTNYFGGGGGGATGAGNAATTSAAGAGGQGFSSSITGLPVCYAAGGGGGATNATIGAAGTCTNGAATTATPGTQSTAAVSAAANSGSGGGAGGLSSNDDKPSGAGGSGVIIVVYGPSADTAYDFASGDNQYTATGKQVIPAKSSHTFEAWVKARTLTTSGWNDIFRQEDRASNFNSFEVAVHNGQLQVIDSIRGTDAGTLNTENTSNSNEKLVTNQWYHIAVAADYAVSGSNTDVTLNVFVNGQLTSTKTYSDATANLTNIGSTQLSIGGFYRTSDRGWDGQIDQVKIWNGALTQSEITKSMHAYSDRGVISSSGASLRAFYDFNTSTTSSLVDQTGTGYNFSPKTATATSTEVATISTVGNSNIYKFTRSYLTMWGGWTSPQSSATASALSIGGGGGGGENVGAGGSGGGLAYGTSRSLTSGATYAVTVGQGGVGGMYYANHSSDSTTISGLRDGGAGQDSTFGFATALVGTGGTGGQTYWADNKCAGATVNAVSSVGSAGTGGETNSSGGNGGAGYVGGGAAGNAGSAGNSNSITGAAVTYGGGGGGGGWAGQFPGAGGSGGGGAGGTSGTSLGQGVAGSANTGGGGGGGAVSCGAGGFGGSGVVVVSFLVAYKITFDGNSGTSTLAIQNINAGSSANLSAATGVVTRANYRFTGWNTAANGSGTAYADAASITPGADTTLYAQWIPSLPLIYYNFSDRDSTHDGTTAVTNLGSNSAYTATKIYTPTHDYTNGTLNFTGTTYANGSYVDVADINTAQFSGGITVDFEADFGATKDNWERVIDFGVSGSTTSNLLVARSGTSDDIVLEIYNGSTSQGWCKVIGGIPTSAQMVRWTFNVDGTNCKVWKNGVAQTTTVGLNPSYTSTTTSAFPYVPANVTWAQNYIAKSNWSADAAAKMALRSIRIYAGAYTAAQVGDITYRTINFDGNYTGSSPITSRYTSGKTALQTAPTRTGFTFGGWYDSIVSASGTLIGTSGAVYSPLSTPMNLYAAWVSSATVVDVAWNELNYDYTAGHYVNKVGTGFAVNDKVLFNNVITRNGVCVDSVVTTKTLDGATVKFYETGTGAGGAKTNFEVDMDFAANNSYGEYQFDFYTCGTYGTAGEERVELRNLAITLIDIDYYQWNEATGMDSFTLASNTKIKYGPAGTPLANGTTIGTTNGTISSYPASVRFQGPSSIDATIPEDQAIINYGAIQTFNIKMGRSASGKPNYFGVAFKSLTWGSTTPATQGPATTYTITYDGNGNGGGTSPASQTGKVGANFSAQSNSGTLTKTGYTFGGWNTAANGSGTAYAVGSSILVPNGGMTLYAVWVAAQLTLTYDANGGTGAPAVETRNSGATANLSATAPTRSGYVFGGWNTLANGNGTNYASSASYTMGSASSTLYAKWTTATGSIAYDGNSSTGGSVPTTQSGNSGTATTAAAVGTLVRQYYTFSGWNTAANGSGTDYSAGGAINYPANGVTTTLYAQWTPILYTLSYNATGGTLNPAVASAAYAYNAAVTITGVVPTRTGYTFAGWNTSSTLIGGTDYSSSASMNMPGANAVLYAKWTAITYTLTYDKNDSGAGNPPSAVSFIVYGTTVNSLGAAPTAPSGKKFNGWNTAAGGTGSTYSVGGSIQVFGNTTLYAQWVDATVNLFFSANGGTGAPTSTTSAPNTNTTLPAGTPTRTGYTFAGWTTDQGGTGTVYGPNSTFPVPGSDTTLYAQWTPISYNFIYDANGGTGAPATVAYYMGNFVTISGTASRTGYNFAGWNSAANGSGADYPDGTDYIMGNSNMTIYAKWTAIPYALNYNSNGGTTAPATETRYVGASANISGSTPTRTGYAFGSWNTALDGSGTSYNASASLTMPAANVTLYAQWVANGNTVTYNVNGGSSTAPTGGTFSFNSSVPVNNSTPTWAGHRFLGWNTSANGTGTTYAGGTSFTMPNNAVVLYAQWGLTSNVFSYDANGGSGAKPAASYSYGATVTVTTDAVTRGGYTFVGWNSMADGTGTNFGAGSTFTMPANDVVAYAIWSANAYTLFYNMNGGTGSINAQPGSYQTLMTVSNTAPTRTGFTFSGWSTVISGSGGTDYTGGGTFNLPAANVTLYAKWTAVHYTLTYNANSGGGAPADLTGLSFADSITLSGTKPTRNGYVFTGWTTNANGTGAKYAESGTYLVPAANTTLYAQWIEERYELIYNANGGSGAPGAEDVPPGARNLSSTQPTRPGYTFGGWNTQPNGGGSTTAAGGSFNVPSGNTTLYAVWALADVTIQFDVNGSTDSAPADITDKYQSTVALPGSNTFARAGYTFVAWNTAANGSGQSYAAEADFVMPDTGLTLYAQWSAVYYAVEYSPNGGTGEPADQYANPGQSVVVPPVEPTRSGYDFVNWTSANPGNTVTPGGSITMPSNNVLLVANWTVRAASVPNGGSSSPVVSPSPSPSVGPKKLTSTVYFKGDSAVLQPAAKKKLKALALKAKAFGPAAKVQVIGRVKETNDKSYDMRLSRQRATNVSNYLKKLGVRGGYVITAAGISPENKSISRRVDMYLYWIK